MRLPRARTAAPRGDRAGGSASSSGRLEPERLAGNTLDVWRGGGVRADGAGELADAHSDERSVEPLAIALELERPTDELEAERRRLGMDAVRPPDRHGRAMLVRAHVDRADGAFHALGDQFTCRLHGRARARCRGRRRRSARSGTSAPPARGPPRPRRRTRRRRGSSSARARRRAAASGTRARSRTARALGAGTVPT